MKKPLKIGLVVIGGLIALFISAAVILVATVDPNEYKEEIAQSVKEATGRDLTFEGDIGFNFFPWLGLEVGPMALGNAPGFQPKEMLRISKAMASIRILPLLTGDVAIGEVVLDDFTLNLAVNKQGVSNWADLSDKKKDSGTSDSKPAKKSAKKDSGPESLSVAGVEITGATVHYVNEQTGQKAAITDLNLLIGEVGDRLSTPFELNFGLTLDDPKIDTRPKLTGLATFDQGKSTLAISELALELLNMRWTGLFFAKSAKDTLNYSAELKLARMNPRELLKQLAMTPPVTTDPKALTEADADIKINGTGDSVSLESLIVKLDATTLTGTGSVANFAKPAITVAVNVDDLDVDRYLAPSAKKEDGAAKTEPVAEAEAPATEPDLSALKTLDLTAKLTVGKLKAMNLRITDFLCQTRAKNGVLTIQPFSANLYEGSLTGHSVLDANGKLAAWTETADLKDVQAGPLLKDLTGKDHILGTTVAKYHVTGAGLTPVNIKKSVSGTASFAFTDGAINGVNVAKMIRDAWARLKGKPVSKDEPVKTDFAELLGSAVIEKGHITNNDLLMKSPLLRLTGTGWADLPQNSVDYLATVTVVGTLQGQDGASMEELKGLPLPVRVKGDLDKPEIGLDPKALAKALFKGSFKKGTKDLEKNLKKSILGTGKTGTTSDTQQQKPGDRLRGLIKKK